MVTLISLTAPLVIIHAASGYVDLFSNSLLSIGIISIIYVYLYVNSRTAGAFLCGLLGLTCAAWSKYQLVPIVALVFIVYFVYSIKSIKNKCDCDNRNYKKWLLATSVCCVIAASPYLKNWIIYGNPFWPIHIPLTGDLFAWKWDSDFSDQKPPPLVGYSQFRLFIHSLFEIDHPQHYVHRPRWIIDQGNAWISFRSGGFWYVSVIFNLISLIVLSIFVYGVRGVHVGLSLLVLFILVGFLPQSHELRYYMFIPLVLAATNAMMFNAVKVRWASITIPYQIFVIVLFAIMAIENWTYYKFESVGYLDVAQKWGATKIWPNLKSDKIYCAVGMEPIPILITGPTMTEFTVVERTREHLCPEGSMVITKGEIVPRPVVK